MIIVEITVNSTPQELPIAVIDVADTSVECGEGDPPIAYPSSVPLDGSGTPIRTKKALL